MSPGVVSKSTVQQNLWEAAMTLTEKEISSLMLLEKCMEGSQSVKSAAASAQGDRQPNSEDCDQTHHKQEEGRGILFARNLIKHLEKSQVRHGDSVREGEFSQF